MDVAGQALGMVSQQGYPELVYRAVPELRPQQPGLQSVVRYEAVAPHADKGELTALASRYASNDKLLDGMLDQDTTPSMRRDVHRDLGILPTPLLEQAKQQGLHIWIAPDGTKDAPAHLFKSDVDSAAIGHQWDDYQKAMAPFNQQMGQIKQVLDHDPGFQAAVKHLKAAQEAPPDPHEKPQSGVLGLFGMSKKMQDAQNAANRAMDAALQQHGLKMPTAPDPPPSETAYVNPAEAPSKPDPNDHSDHPFQFPQAGQTLEDVARLHGAKTPDEVHEFVGLAGKMNDALGNGVKPGVPLKAGETLSLPDLYYYQGQRYTRKTRGDIDDMNQAVRDPDISGVTLPSGNMMVKEDAAREPSSGPWGHHRTLLHEFGHFTDWMTRDDPSRGEQHFKTLDAIHTEDGRSGHHYVTAYGGTSREEQYADGFEAYWTASRPDGVYSDPENDANYPDLKQNDPKLFNLLDTEMQAWQHGDVHPQPHHEAPQPIMPFGLPFGGLH